MFFLWYCIFFFSLSFIFIYLTFDPIPLFSYPMQLDNNVEDRDHVVILFQDMLEVVTRDIMMEDYNISRLASFLCNYICYMNIKILYPVASVAWWIRVRVALGMGEWSLSNNNISCLHLQVPLDFQLNQ